MTGRARRCVVVLGVLLAARCASLPPAPSGVPVYSAPLNETSPQHDMPAACRLVDQSPARSMTELEMEGQKDPYSAQRQHVASAGANVLLVRSKMIVSRRDFECPGSSPITDCPPSSGAWFRVVFESYACTADAVRALSAPAK